MPLDAGHIWSRVKMVKGEEILEQLEQEFRLILLPGRASAPAERFLVDDGPSTVGVIRSVTKPFCGACDRVRITADGQLRNCLFAREESDLLTVLREGGSDDDIAEMMHTSIAGKLPGHVINDPGFL